MLLREIESGGPREFAFWTLARLGARVPLCGAAGDVVRAEVVSQWIQRTVRQLKKFPDKAGFALAQMARMTGDRARDLDDGPRRDLLSHLARVKATSGLITMVEQIVPVGHGEMAKLLGDALPAGLELETRV